MNKWYLIEKESNPAMEYEKELKQKLAPFNDVPILFTSVTEKQRIHKALQTALDVYKRRTQRIKTNKLNEVMLPIIEWTPPPATKGKYIKVKYVQQLPTHAPTFAFYCNLPQYIKESYKRFIENQMREKFDFTGVPIQIFFRKK